jgi:hypothetical protein
MPDEGDSTAGYLAQGEYKGGQCLKVCEMVGRAAMLMGMVVLQIFGHL